MIPELGYGAVIVAALLAAYGATAAAVGGRTGRTALLESAQHAALGVFALSTCALLLLIYAFLTFDFSVRYRLGWIDDLYLVLGDFARDGTQATVKVQVNRMVSWIWLGGLILTLGTILAILPERRKAA